MDRSGWPIDSRTGSVVPCACATIRWVICWVQTRGLDAFSSPLAHPDLQGGTRVEIPIGMNLRFPEGTLQRNRIHLEFIVPVHQDLDGPQLTPSSGFAIAWSLAL